MGVHHGDRAENVSECSILHLQFQNFPGDDTPDPRCRRGDPLTHPPSARRGPAPPLLWPTRHTSPRGLYPPCLLSFWDLPPPLQACLTYTEKAGGFNYPKKPSLHEIITENWLEKNYSFREKKNTGVPGILSWDPAWLYRYWQGEA